MAHCVRGSGGVRLHGGLQAAARHHPALHRRAAATAAACTPTLLPAHPAARPPSPGPPALSRKLQPSTMHAISSSPSMISPSRSRNSWRAGGSRGGRVYRWAGRGRRGRNQPAQPPTPSRVRQAGFWDIAAWLCSALSLINPHLCKLVGAAAGGLDPHLAPAAVPAQVQACGSGGGSGSGSWPSREDHAACLPPHASAQRHSQPRHHHRPPQMPARTLGLDECDALVHLGGLKLDKVQLACRVG